MAHVNRRKGRTSRIQTPLSVTGRIVVDPEIMVGKPIIRGTRITVELILRQLAQGLTVEEILKNYPHVTRKDIYAAIAYARDLVAEGTIYPLPVRPHAQAAPQ